MSTDVYTREQRLRKQAELPSLYTNLASLRTRGEASYIEASAAIPERLFNQINELRQAIVRVERELVTLGDESVATRGHEFYREAFDAELAGDLSKAMDLYKSAARYGHPDANAALRSLRYTARKTGGGLPGGWLGNGFWPGLVVLSVVAIMAVMVLSNRFTAPPSTVGAIEPTATATSSVVIVIIPDTATPTPTQTPTFIPTPKPSNTPLPTPTEIPSTATPTAIPTLRSAPKIIGPKDDLVWKDGTVVFEFEDFRLAYNELYCLNTMRGYDKTNTENWSYPPIGNKKPFIAIEANVFRVAQQQGIRCIVWSAAIGVDSCTNIISENTIERGIGLPQGCEFRK